MCYCVLLNKNEKKKILMKIQAIGDYESECGRLLPARLPSNGSDKLNNRDFFETNIEACLDRLYGTALRLTKNVSDAEDLVAETVMRGLDKIDSLKERDRFVHWLVRIMSNCFISDCRKKENRTPHEQYEEDVSESDTSFSLFDRLHQPFLLWWGTPEQEFLNKTLSEDISIAIDTLKDKYRIVVVLSDVEGMSYQEIADAIEVPIGTVRSRLARGRSMLQQLLWEHGKDRELVKSSKDVSDSTRGDQYD